LQFLEVFQNLVGVLHPVIVSTRNDDATKGQTAHEEQDRDGRPERESLDPIGPRPGRHFALTATSAFLRTSDERDRAMFSSKAPNVDDAAPL
jgi:hypothetical protein